MNECINKWINYVQSMKRRPEEAGFLKVFLSCGALYQTLWTSSQPTWRTWQRWSQRLSFIPTTVTCLSIAAVKAPCASVTWEKQHCVTSTLNVSKTCWETWWTRACCMFIVFTAKIRKDLRLYISMLTLQDSLKFNNISICFLNGMDW